MKSPAVRCPVSRTIKVIGGKWKPLILYCMAEGIHRNGEFLRFIPDISQKVLTQHLREMEADGLVSRKVHPVVPPHVDYILTDLGRSLEPILDAMCKWGQEHEREFPAVE